MVTPYPPSLIDLSQDLCSTLGDSDLEHVAIKVVKKAQRTNSWAPFHLECLGLDTSQSLYFPDLVAYGYIERAPEDRYRVTSEFLEVMRKHVHE